MLLANWFIWPGIALTTLRHAAASTLFALNIWLYCSMASACSTVSLPPARTALLNANAMLVASSRFLVNGASCWTMPIMLDVVVGRPSMLALMRLMAAAASFESYPKFFMTLGKLFIVSARLMAPSTLLVMMFETLLNADCANPLMAPNFAAPHAVKKRSESPTPLAAVVVTLDCMLRKELMALRADAAADAKNPDCLEVLAFRFV